MVYKSLGLGALLVSALRTALTNPALQTQADEATAALGELTSRVNDLVDELDTNDALDVEQTETLAGIQADLAELAQALTPVLTEVEAPANAPSDPEAAPSDPEAAPVDDTGPLDTE